MTWRSGFHCLLNRLTLIDGSLHEFTGTCLRAVLLVVIIRGDRKMSSSMIEVFILYGADYFMVTRITMLPLLSNVKRSFEANCI